MNKKEAKELASRVLLDWFDKCQENVELVYDEFCEESARGRRLSDRDYERVDEAMDHMMLKLVSKGLDRYLERRDGRDVPADGKPGAKSKRWSSGAYVEKK